MTRADDPRRPGAAVGAAVDVTETIRCALTPAAMLRIRVAGSPNADRGSSGVVVRVDIDDDAFELVPDSSIDALDAGAFPRVRAAVIEECERRLQRRIAALEAELAPNGGDDRGNGSDSRERWLRHAGRVPVDAAAAALDGRSPWRVTPAVASGGAYVTARPARAPASNYLPAWNEEHAAHTRRAGATTPSVTLTGRGAYVPDRVLAVAANAYVAPSRPASQFPGSTRSGSPEHEAASRLLRCKDLLRALCVR